MSKPPAILDTDNFLLFQLLVSYHKKVLPERGTLLYYMHYAQKGPCLNLNFKFNLRDIHDLFRIVGKQQHVTSRIYLKTA